VMKFFENLIYKKKAPKPSATAARERLQILLAHERFGQAGDDFLNRIRADIMEVVGKYMQVDMKNVNVSLEKEDNVSTLAIEIEVPVAEVAPLLALASPSTSSKVIEDGAIREDALDAFREVAKAA
jgi:cell division topological specificity factor